MKKKRVKKVGIALGCGGARAFAHIGVLKVFEKNKIPIDYISGSSMGALIAALYSANPDAEKLEKMGLKENFNKFFDYTIPLSGLIKGDRIKKYIKKKLNNVDFKDLKIPLYVTSFDIKNKQEIIFHKGNVANAVRASFSLPGFLVPTENKNKILVDGGLTDPVPFGILEKTGADIIIAVNVNSYKLKKPISEESVDKKGIMKKPNIIKNLSESFHIILSEISDAEIMGRKNILSLNINLEKIDDFDFNKYKDAVKIGEKAATKFLKNALVRKKLFGVKG